MKAAKAGPPSRIERVERAMRALMLIESTADRLSYLESLEEIDTRRVAIREAATEALRDLQHASGLWWTPNTEGPTRRDGVPLVSLPGHYNRYTGRRTPSPRGRAEKGR